MQQITYPFSASLEGEEITTDAVPEFNWSPTTWVITQHLEEDANLMRKEEVSRRGPPQTVAKKLCYRKDDSTRKPAFMRLYRQLPTIGTEYDRPTVRALQAIPNQENDELETFRRLKLLRCSVTPELLAYSEAPQGDYGPVPGGFSICIIWDKVPGDSLSLDYFWGLDRDARDAIRGKFREVFEKFLPCGIETVSCGPSNLIYDPVSGSMYICGFRMAMMVSPKEWKDSLCGCYGLIEPRKRK